ncbi:MAG: glycoside hydrolase, partial [Melioribacteraceae bacterium]|nr:glycoside hydrolase [Melioribacteraceae bacterium]
MNKIILILLLSFVSIFSQIESAKRLLGNEIYGDDMIFTSYDISTKNNDIVMAWLNSFENNLTAYTDTLYFAITNDFGDTFTQYHSFSFVDFKFYKNSTVKIIQNGDNSSIYFYAEEIINNIRNNGIYYLSSNDNGATWSDITKLAKVNLLFSNYRFDLFTNENGTVSFAYYKTLPNAVFYQYSNDNGTTWTELKLNSIKVTSDITAVQSNNNEYRIYFLAENNSDVNELRELLSTDNGATWGEKVIMPYLLEDSFILGKRRYI